jgi:hypothetical protein
MRLALGLSMHTGWAAAVVAGGDWGQPTIVSRERLELCRKDDERFVFHRAAEMPKSEAETWVARARKEAIERASRLMRPLTVTHALKACAVVAKKGAMLPLELIVGAHPRIHTAEGCFYRDVVKAAAEGLGMRVEVISPNSLNAKDGRLVRVGRMVGKPWSVDWKMAVMAAWQVA